MTETHLPAAPRPPRVLVLAIDGLDWPLLHTLVDAGQMPYCAQLLSGGAHGRMQAPAPHSAAAHWSSVATGVMADRHGICHDLAIRADGLTLQAASADTLRCAPFWQQAIDAGLTVRVAGWPAMLPARLSAAAAPGCMLVADGFQHPDNGGDICWPLAPDAVAPASARDTVQDARVHPGDLDAALIAPLLGRPRGAAEAALSVTARQLLARWASVHNLGVAWASQTDWALLALRFDSLPGWLATLQQHGIGADDALVPWYRYLDLMLGRYMGLLGRDAHLLLLSDYGLPPAAGRVGSSTLDRLLGAGTAGGIALAGPGVAPDSLLSAVSALDVAPTVRALLGLPSAEAGPGRDLLAAPQHAQPFRAVTQPAPAPPRLDWTELCAAPAVDTAALAWLREHGCAAPDTTALESMVQTVRADTLANWATASAAGGDMPAAIAALQHALALRPSHLGHRLMLGQWLLDAGRAAECELLLAGLPDAARAAPWPDVLAALLAFGARDWAGAEAPLLRLAVQESAPINAAAWLGRVRMAQLDWADAAVWLRRAVAAPGGEMAWEGLARACMQLGKPVEAVGALTRAIAVQPALGRLHLLRAEANEQAGEISAAQDGCGARWQSIRP